MRQRYRQHPETGKLYPIEEYERLFGERRQTLHYVMEDMKPYRSPIDGSVISSRSQHRAHKRQHGVIEVGNEKLRPGLINRNYEPTGVKQDLIDAFEKHR